MRGTEPELPQEELFGSLVLHMQCIYRMFAERISPRVLSGLTELLFQLHFFVGKTKLFVSNINA